MKVEVVSDAEGRIISLSVPGDSGPGPSGIARAGVVVEGGQATHTLEVPPDLAERSLVELHERLRVEFAEGRARLVKREP